MSMIKSPAQSRTWEKATGVVPVVFLRLSGTPLRNETCPECGGDMQFYSYACKDGSVLYYAGCITTPLSRKSGNGAPTENIDHTYFYGSKHFVGRPGRRPKEWEKRGDKPRTDETDETDKTDKTDETDDDGKDEVKTDKRDDKLEILKGLLDSLGSNDKRVDGLIDRVDKLEKREGRIEHIKIGELPAVKLDGVVHSAMPKLLALHAAGVRNFLLAGPGGSGKTTLAKQIADVLKLPHYETSLMGQTAVERIEGFLDLEGKYRSTLLVDSLKIPGVTVMDEAFSASSNTLIWFNAPLASNRIHTPGGTFDRHPDNVIIFIDNTTGLGGNRTYTGRMKPDGATLDRFFTVFVDYDEAVERGATGCGDKLYEMVRKVRQNLTEAKNPRITGLRWLKRLVILMAVNKLNEEKAIETIMGNDYEAWSDDEKRIAIEGV